MAINEYKVYSFRDYIEVTTTIGKSRKIAPNSPPVLWSRGHRQEEWNLQPTLLRDVPFGAMNIFSDKISGRAVEEEVRRQHYLAKNYHFLSKDPKTNIGWYEVMQHHGVKTRLLDWSESTLHSLLFALECFFDNEKYRTNDRIDSSPCVWILEPIEWNMETFKYILSDQDLIDQCIESLEKGSFDMKKLQQNYVGLSQVFDAYIGCVSAGHLRGIFNLSSILEELQSREYAELLYLLENGELYYCLGFLLTFIYLSTKHRKWDHIMPLSIVESYHSERIRAQKGAFSVFPYYEEDSAKQSLASLGILLDAMEYMDKANHFLHKIVLNNADEIAFEVMNAGLNISWLYPEMPVVANAIEQREIFY
ncbi:MAG: FRG domain-containing protein [Lachnospiraceae bacterium]|nr:FRG domain-containing protein [Lachnospiraceae bacterium]